MLSLTYEEKGIGFGKVHAAACGHLAMIDFALLYCEHLVVMLCASEKEQIGGQVRKSWLEESFGDNERISSCAGGV